MESSEAGSSETTDFSKQEGEQAKIETEEVKQEI